MREVAKKVRVVDLISGIFKEADRENKKAAYVITPQEIKVSRVNIVGTMLDKYIAEDESYGFLIVNDMTESIRVKFFDKNVKLIKDLEIGSIVTVIGKVREYNGEIYIAGEAVGVVDIKTEARRKQEAIEFLKNFSTKKDLTDYKQLIFKFIREMDDGNGVEIGKIIDSFQIPLSFIDKVISELLDEKKIIEVLPSVYKVSV
ncbi:MAG: OB-fold nucleic acid binding domain-containing protein [Candidatus Aenigmatarchaeota archaeon]